MRILMLGTGSADGWPNPFCTCRSCDAMRQLRQHRAPTSALVDDVLLLDCGPATQHAVGRAGRSFDLVEHVLITHGHPDHLHPAFLLSRQWIPGGRRLHVWGPPRAIDTCRDWLGPEAPVDLHCIETHTAFELETDAGTYLIQPVPAAHGHGNGDVFADEALLYAVTSPAGQRLLYATDTGELPDATIAALDPAFDAILIEETFGAKDDHGHGHLDFTSLPRVLDRMRSSGCLTPATTVVAIHLSHHNPEPQALRRTLAAMGVRIVNDLDVIDTHDSTGAGHSLLVTGGARSGKSHYAEARAALYDTVAYVATGGTRPDDPEWQARVRAHQQRRPTAWTTHETTGIADVLTAAAASTAVLVDCLSLWLTHVLDELGAWQDADFTEADPRLAEHMDALDQAVRECRADVILVTNEVGMGVVPPTSAGRLFRDCLGRLNARLSATCSESVLVVSGRPLPLPSPAH